MKYNDKLEEFMKWGYIISYLNIKEEDYFYDEEILVVKRDEKFSPVEILVIERFCSSRKYTYEAEENRIIINLKK